MVLNLSELFTTLEVEAKVERAARNEVEQVLIFIKSLEDDDAIAYLLSSPSGNGGIGGFYYECPVELRVVRLCNLGMYRTTSITYLHQEGGYQPPRVPSRAVYYGYIRLKKNDVPYGK